MKIILTPKAEPKGGAPGYLYCVYCADYKPSGMFDGPLCHGCSIMNREAVLAYKMDTSNNRLEGKIDLILKALKVEVPKLDEAEAPNPVKVAIIPEPDKAVEAQKAPQVAEVAKPSASK